MNLGTFRNMLAGFMGREPGVFVTHNVNLLDRAINQARKWAERQHRFECARESAVVRDVSLSDGALLSSAVSLYEAGRRVAIRTIERAFLSYEDGQGQFPIEVVSRAADMADAGRTFIKLVGGDPTKTPQHCNGGPFRLVRHNDRLYISPYDRAATSTSRDLFLDVVVWLPDYVKEDDTDFFLDHCEDFMLVRAAVQLNLMLKEDQRVAISAKVLEDAWETVMKVDNDAITGAADDANLD